MAHENITALAAELISMAAADQQNSYRANDEDPAEQLAWRRLTARHGDRLNEIMDEYGWPTAELVGDDAARGAWLIAQHADRQLGIQRRALQLMEQAVATGSASPRELAFLRDRTLVNDGHKQVYGTQIAGIKDGSPVPWPCEQPQHMDKLRAEVGIEPFAEYTAKYTAKISTT
ncbi:hypothetical protein EYS09_21535 [Streptomyces kasugaensis]|uniref:Uncharacterized protein n=1 Tax=Streptomyces kasugaensis TaxID=1946 RepID=A0A4Q9HRS7_STRKA|nr:DUF6624 domain-containing protein [Streptomyces kasugaensis]TBO57672.1 hypothetical protein EYS09_21535 [Streptomyces kasugaensis]